MTTEDMKQMILFQEKTYGSELFNEEEESLVVKEISSRYDINHSDFVLETYNEAQSIRLDYFKEITNYEMSINIPMANDLFHYKNMLNVMIEQLIPWSWPLEICEINQESLNETSFKLFLKNLFSELDLIDNTLNKHIEIVYKFRNDEVKTKKFPSGMKITRFFVSLGELLKSKDKDLETAIGKFRLSSEDTTSFTLSLYNPSILFGGIIGNSCLSPNGSNAHSVFINMGYKNVAILHDLAFKHRAWVFIDNQNKLYNVSRAYPYEHYLMQISAFNFFDKLGYKKVQPEHFEFLEYFDDSPAKGFHFQDSLDFEKRYNCKDTAHNYTKGLFGGYPNERVAEVYACDNCDCKSVNSSFIYCNGLCYSCHDESENHFSCYKCGDYFHNDEGYYHEDIGETYCEYCHNRVQEQIRANMLRNAEEIEVILENDYSLSIDEIKEAITIRDKEFYKNKEFYCETPKDLYKLLLILESSGFYWEDEDGYAYDYSPDSDNFPLIIKTSRYALISSILGYREKETFQDYKETFDELINKSKELNS